MGDILLGAKRLGRSKTLKDGTADGSGAADRGGGAVAGGNGATANDDGEADRGGGVADLKSVAPMEKSRLIGR